MNFNITSFKKIRSFLMVALLIWLKLGSNFEILYGGCRGPARLKIGVEIIYSLITVITLLLVYIFRKRRIAFYILLCELIIWFFHFLVFRGWPLMYEELAGSTAYFYYYTTPIFDFIGFLLRILLLTSFCWYKRNTKYVWQVLVLTIFVGCFILLKMFPADWFLRIVKPLIQLHISFFSFFGIRVHR